MKRPRVLWIHQNFVSARQAGNSRPIRILAALAHDGWCVDVITPEQGYLDREPQSSVTAENDPCIVIHRLPVKGGWSVAERRRSYARFTRAAWLHARRLRADLVFATTPPPPQVALSALLAFLRRLPLVFEVRDLWPAFIAEAGVLRSRIATVVMEWIEAWALHAAARVIAVSPSYVPYLVACGVERDRIRVIPTGGDPAWSRDAEAGREWRAEHGLDGRFVVLYAGSFNETYGLDLVLASARELEQSHPHIVFVFQGDGRGRAAIEEHARASRNVRVLAPSPRDELRGALSGADCGLVSLGSAPLLSAMLPAKLFEYMVAGLPVVCNVRGMPGAIIEAANCGVVCAPASLAQAVISLSETSASSRASAGARGREWVLRHMPADEMGARVAETIRAAKIAGQRRRCFVGAARATLDVITRRSPRAIARCYNRNMDETIREELAEWIASDSCTPGCRETAVVPGFLSVAASRFRSQ